MRRALRFRPTFLLIALVVACGRTPAEDRRDVILVADETDAPMKLRATFHHGAGYSLPVQSLAIRGRAPHSTATAIVVAGCAHSELASDFPTGVLRLSVDETASTPDRLKQSAACASRDPARIEDAIREELRFMLSAVRRLDAANGDKLVIFASGEAAPIVAGFSAEVAGKVLLGDPCLVDWPEAADGRTPTLVLWGDKPSGLQWGSGDPPNVTMTGSDRPQAVRDAAAASTTSCEGKPRPHFPPNYAIVQGPGPVGMFRRPGGVQAAGRDFMAQRFAE